MGILTKYGSKAVFLLSVLWALTSSPFVNARTTEVRYSVLCYHDIVDESRPLNRPIVIPKLNEMSEHSKPRQYFSQTIELSTLITHFNWLKANGYTPVSFQQILDAQQGKS